jgi:SSS family solute:Na+ symporter
MTSAFLSADVVLVRGHGSTNMNIQIDTLDLVIIVIYLLGIVGLGCWVGLRHRRHGGESTDYFLAGGTLTWPIIGLALFSTNISTIHLVSFAQEGYINGLAYGNFEWMAPFTLIITALFFAPFYIRSRVATLPDFLEMRYSRPCRDWLAVLSIVAAIFIHIGFSLYTGAVVMHGLFGIPESYILLTILVIAGLTGVYTIIGGLISVVVTESIQTVILLIGAMFMTAYAFYYVGGFAGINDTLEANGEIVKMTVLRSAEEQPELPWYAVLLGYPVIGIWYWCTDQTIVQRVLGAKDENHARIGPLFCGFIKILPVFLFVLPGLMCYVLLEQGKLDESRFPAVTVGGQVTIDGQPVSVPEAGRVELTGKKMLANRQEFDYTDTTAYIEDRVIYKDGKPIKDTAKTYAFMIKELLPVGLKGVVAAALLAALMGTVSGALNSIATLFSYDIVKRWRPTTSDHQLVVVGRITTFVAMIVAVLWSPFIARFPSIYQGITALICYIAPPITAVFMMGVLWRRASSISAQLTLYIGSALGLAVFLLDWFKVQFPDFITKQLHMLRVVYHDGAHDEWRIVFMVASFYLCVICLVVQALISAVIPHQHTSQSEKLVWSNPLEALRSENAWRGIGDFRILAALLFVVMIGLYVVFA